MRQLSANKVYGQYECTHVLGTSSSGAVYKAHHMDDKNQKFAVRILQLPDKDAEYVINEIDEYMVSIKDLNAPHMVPVLDYGHEELAYYIAMPYIPHMTLLELIERTAQTPQAMPSFGEILTLTETMGEALKHIHDLNLSHGAIEPRNIFVTPDNKIYLADMGLARLLKILFSLQNTGSFWAGGYTAPEVWDGERITPSSDLYSLACVLYHLVTGRAPFRAKTIFDMMEQHKNAIATPPTYIRDDSPFALTMFFLTATAKTPPERFRNIQEFVSEFKSSIQGDEGEPTRFFEVYL